MDIATRGPSAVILAPTYAAASGDLKALLSAQREGYLWRSDLTPARITAVRKQLADAERACLPPNPVVVASWLKKLTPLVTNAPTELSRGMTEAIFEVCADIPAGAWNPESRLAWVRQPERNGYPVGSRWPSPGELFQHLRPYAEQVRDEVAGLKRILAMLDEPKELVRKKPTQDELAAVAKAVQEVRANMLGGDGDLNLRDPSSSNINADAVKLAAEHDSEGECRDCTSAREFSAVQQNMGDAL